MLATAKPSTVGIKPPPAMSVLPSSPLSTSSLTNSLTIHAQARTLSDTDLTSLSWLQKPGVLASMCTALTGSPHRVNKASSTRAFRRPRQQGKMSAKQQLSINRAKEADKIVNVILNVRNRRYNENGEEVHKPPLSFACMIFMALESSPTKTLPVKEVYDWIVWKFPFYRTAASGWKNSIRHNLSLNKCFKKVDRYSTRSKSALSKGGFWTVDPDYRRSLLTALERCPYHPYHSYLSPPLSPSSSSSSLESLDPAERDAALTMCMISGGSESGGFPGKLAAVYHDHTYCKIVARPPVTIRLPRRRNKVLTLDEIAAAAELILAEEERGNSPHESSDEGMESDYEEDVDSEGDESEDGDLGDSGYGGGTSPMNTKLSMEEMGADALLCLATSSAPSSHVN